jgi:peptide/nickel transport system permease protein
MIPRRLKVWLLVWTPLVWLALELIWYPHDRYVSQGLIRLLGGFFDERIASYPAWTLLAAGAVVLAVGTWTFLRDPLLRRSGVTQLAVGAVLVTWGVVAGLGAESGWSLGAHTSSLGWLWQTAVVALVPMVIVEWARAYPERAELFAWNGHQIWKLYRANWQGLFGLGVLVIFILMALLAPFIAAHSYLDPNAQIGDPFAPPEWSYYKILGLDEQGLSIWAEYVWSSRISLSVGLLATLICSSLGALVGIWAGYYGGWQGQLWMRVTDVFLVLPWLPFAMILAAAWGRSYGIIIINIGITSWPTTARLVRADVLKIRELQFIERARAIGSGDGHIMAKHVLPNVFPLIFANTVLVVAIAILSETTLSFLGLGDPLNFSWGTMLRNAWLSGAAGLTQCWAYLFAPGVSIVFVVLGFTFVGQALDEVLDPKLRKREESDTAGRRQLGDGREPLDATRLQGGQPSTQGLGGGVS